MDHRPTLGSQLRALQPWSKDRRLNCRCGQEWTPEHKAQAGRPWQAGDGPIPDGEQRPPLDFIQAAEGGFHRLGYPATDADKRGNGGRWAER